MLGLTHHSRRDPRNAKEIPSARAPGRSKESLARRLRGSTPQGWEASDLLRETLRSAPDTKRNKTRRRLLTH